MGCKKYRGFWILERYGELDPRRRRRLERHLAACSRCRQEAIGWERAMRELDCDEQIDVPMPDWHSAWNRIDAGVAVIREKSSGRRFWPTMPVPRRVVFGTFMALAVFVMGIVIGRVLFQKAPAPANDASGGISMAGTDISRAAARLYLSEVGVLITDLANSRDRAQVAPGLDDAALLDLIFRQRLIRQACRRSGNQALVELLDDIELVLLEVRYNKNSPEGMARLQQLLLQRELPGRLNLFRQDRRDIRI